jgi:feruloyl-CoA synthase
LNFAPPAIDVERRADGMVVLRSPRKLEPYDRCPGDMLIRWATTAPDRLFLAERAGERDWRKLTYGEVAAATCNIGEALLERGLSLDRRIEILSDNSVDHALLPGSMLIAYSLRPFFRRVRLDDRRPIAARTG